MKLKSSKILFQGPEALQSILTPDQLSYLQLLQQQLPGLQGLPSLPSQVNIEIEVVLTSIS